MPPRPSTEKPIDRFRLDGRTVVVTGGASGLGQTFAESPADAGARVAVFDRVPMDETAGLLSDRGLMIHADLSEPEQVQADRRQDAPVEQRRGRRPGEQPRYRLGARAGGRGHRRGLRPCPDRQPAQHLPTTKALLPALVGSGRGSVISFSSYLGLAGRYPDFPVTAIPYAGSKAGVVGFTRRPAVDYGRDQIRANVIAPCWHPATNLAREYSKKLDQAGSTGSWSECRPRSRWAASATRSRSPG